MAVKNFGKLLIYSHLAENKYFVKSIADSKLIPTFAPSRPDMGCSIAALGLL